MGPRGYSSFFLKWLSACNKLFRFKNLQKSCTILQYPQICMHMTFIATYSLFGWLVRFVAGSWRSTAGWFVWEKNTVPAENLLSFTTSHSQTNRLICVWQFSPAQWNLYSWWQTRQSKDNEITHNNEAHGLTTFCDKVLAFCSEWN